MKIALLSEDDRPMEKILEKGPAALSNSELVALVIRGGLKGKNAVELARELLYGAGGSLTALASTGLNEMMNVSGIGRMKAASIAAALELGRRFASETPESARRTVTTAGDVYRIMGPVMKGLGHEESWLLLLNRSGAVTGKEFLSKGGLDSTVIDRRVVVTKALEYKATAVVLIHNHPSGNPRPGRKDISETAALKKSLETFSIGLLDHVIICDGSFYSFADEMVYRV